MINKKETIYIVCLLGFLFVDCIAGLKLLRHTGQTSANLQLFNLILVVFRGISWYFVVIHGISWYFVVFRGISWYFVVFCGISWYFMVFRGISRYFVAFITRKVLTHNYRMHLPVYQMFK